MKTLRSVENLEQLRSLIADVGSLLVLADVGPSLGQSRTHAYRLAEQGKLRVYSYMGTLYVPLVDVLERRRLRVVASCHVPALPAAVRQLAAA